MADNRDLASLSGNVATDERTIASATVHVQRVSDIGNSSLANSQVSISSTAATIAAARETRRSLLIINRQPVAVWVGEATVTTANGVRLDPGDSLRLETTVLVQGITEAAYTATGDAKVHAVETFDA